MDGTRATGPPPLLTTSDQDGPWATGGGLGFQTDFPFSHLPLGSQTVSLFPPLAKCTPFVPQFRHRLWCPRGEMVRPIRSQPNPLLNEIWCFIGLSLAKGEDSGWQRQLGECGKMLSWPCVRLQPSAVQENIYRHPESHARPGKYYLFPGNAGWLSWSYQIRGARHPKTGKATSSAPWHPPAA